MFEVENRNRKGPVMMTGPFLFTDTLVISKEHNPLRGPATGLSRRR
jgi:hypothetical protein